MTRNHSCKRLLWFAPGIQMKLPFGSRSSEFVSAGRFSWCILNSSPAMISATHPLTPSCVLFLFLCQRLRVRQHFKMQTPLPRCPRWPSRVMAAAGGRCGLLSLQYRLAALLARSPPPCCSFVHSAPTHSSLASLHEAVPKITLQEHLKKRKKKKKPLQSSASCDQAAPHLTGLKINKIVGIWTAATQISRNIYVVIFIWICFLILIL